MGCLTVVVALRRIPESNIQPKRRNTREQGASVRRRRFVAWSALTAVIIAGAAGTAAAYFSASGSGSSTALCRGCRHIHRHGRYRDPSWDLLSCPDSTVGGPNIEHFAYSVTNNSAGNVFLNHVTISLTGLPLLIAKANWFSIGRDQSFGSTNTQNPATTLGGWSHL